MTRILTALVTLALVGVFAGCDTQEGPPDPQVSKTAFSLVDPVPVVSEPTPTVAPTPTVTATPAPVVQVAPVTAYPIVGKVAETYTKAGGAAKFGDPRSAEKKATVSSTNGYGQPFTKGFVFWSRVGSQTFTYPAGPKLAKVSNERDALASSGYRPGVLYRTAKLCDANTLDKLVLSTVLRGGTILDLRTSGTCTDLKLAGVGNVRTSVPSHADYARYVTGSTERKAFTAALRVLANSPGPILLHCTAGKDRTGWTVAIVLHVLGASDTTVKAEYFRTADGSTSRWNAGNNAVAKVGGWDKYIAQLLTPTEIQQLRNRYL